MCIDRDDSSNEFPEYKIEKHNLSLYSASLAFTSQSSGRPWPLLWLIRSMGTKSV